MTEQQVTEPQNSADTDRDEALRKAYQQATADLRKNHRDEFNELRKQHAASLGHDWTPKPSEAERARQQVQTLLAQHPELAEEFGQSTE